MRWRSYKRHKDQEELDEIFNKKIRLKEAYKAQVKHLEGREKN